MLEVDAFALVVVFVSFTKFYSVLLDGANFKLCGVMRVEVYELFFFFFSSRRRHTRFDCDWSSDVCSSDLRLVQMIERELIPGRADRVDLAAAVAAGVDGGGGRHADDRPRDRPRREEIGRASCRGRGEISVVAGSLKKKKKKERCRC